ncbi:hypothetical protein ACFWP7_42540, partial [Streptomyces sp. NPDC058470]|uniref:hypothetical protein n=1 Tax=Streptomyces sp. NPDC058470 TaxID=3346515 RepID=UPI003658137E
MTTHHLNIQRHTLDGHHITDQPAITRHVLPNRRHRTRDPRNRSQHRLDLTQLDPMTTHLHLIVDTTHKLQHARIRPPHHITRAIHPGAIRTKRISNETLRGEPRTPQITPRHTLTSDEQLTRHPDRDQ